MSKKRHKAPPLPIIMVGPCKETEGADVATAIGLDSGVLISRMVDRFLGWQIPKSVCSDTCVSDRDYKHPRYGTNLLTAIETRQMIEYLFLVTALGSEKKKEKASESS